MDSVTQAVLGAAVGQAAMGKHVGRVAPIVGAMLGTLPDLDVLISFGGAVENFTYHRSFSHSLIVLLAITPLLVWLILKCHSASRPYKKQWGVAVLAILWTHVLLDAFTVYGTQLLWPLTEYPFGLSSVFIIDPAYTLPLLLGLVMAGIWGWNSERSHKVALASLMVSSAYLMWSLTAKSLVGDLTDKAMAQRNIEPLAVLSTPAPLNTFLWRVIVLGDNEYHIGHMALWDDPEEIDFARYPKGEDLLTDIHEQWDVQRLAWFSKGFYRAALRGDQVVMTDLRMGFEVSYAFNFAVGRQSENGRVLAQKAHQIEDVIDISSLGVLWDRLWDPSVSLHPPSAPSLSSPKLN